jgi:Flp pilus assembly pilin Flp
MSQGAIEMTRAFFRLFVNNERGTTVTEFGLIAVPLSMMMMGALDAGHSYYVNTVLSGEINKLARNSSLEGASVAITKCQNDKALKIAVHTVAPTAKISPLTCDEIQQRYERISILEGLESRTPAETTELNNIYQDINNILNEDIKIERRYYKTFSNAADQVAETWTDTDHNGTCNGGEPFKDGNRNNVWDADGGDDGQGGARDVVIIKVSVSYQRLFPVQKLLGLPDGVVLISDSILANQPFGNQSHYTPGGNGNCS